MYLLENPVLQRELSPTCGRRGRLCCCSLTSRCSAAARLSRPGRRAAARHGSISDAAKRLVNLFFLGQYMLVSLMAPSFAAGAITGEKERESYEMLLASPLRPGGDRARQARRVAVPARAILMICSLPIVMLCLPLGGVSLYEVLAAYFAMISSVALFGMISLWCSSYFRRTSARRSWFRT